MYFDLQTLKYVSSPRRTKTWAKFKEKKILEFKTHSLIYWEQSMSLSYRGDKFGPQNQNRSFACETKPSWLIIPLNRSSSNSLRSLFSVRLSPESPSEGRGRRRSPGQRQSPVQGSVILSCVLHFRRSGALVHGRARGGRCGWVTRARVVAAGPSEELGAQAGVYPPILGHGSQGRVAHRPQAGVLTVQGHQ